MAGEFEAQIRSARASTGDVVIYILRPQRNVVTTVRPNITMVKGKRQIGRQITEETQLRIGDEVVAGPGTSVVLEFVIGGTVRMGPNASVQIESERSVNATGESKAQLIKELSKDIAWAGLTLYGSGVIGRAGRFINANGCVVRNGVILADATTQAAIRLIPNTVRLASNTIQSITDAVQVLLVWNAGPSAPEAPLPRAPDIFGPVGIKG